MLSLKIERINMIGITEFYKKILPSQGVYCIATIETTGKTTNYYVESIDEVEPKINELKQDGHNIYVTHSSQKSYSRKDNALYSRSLFVDLDVDPQEGVPDEEKNNKKYKSKEEANNALDKFLIETNLPPPIRVDSGRGIWAWWAFNADIPIEEWKEYAEKFKKLCLDKDFKIDPSVTSDKGRITRAPNCLNYKTNPPSPTKVISDELPVYVFEEFKEFLGPVDSSTEDILKAAFKGLTEEERRMHGLDNWEASFDKILKESMLGTGCNQIKHMMEHPNDVSYELWTAGLTIASRCVDSETAIHTLSEGAKNYSREATILKAASFDGVHSCGSFDNANPGGCNGCQHRGRITNPLKLGKVFKMVPVPKQEQIGNVITQESTTALSTEEPFILPASMFPYIHGANGGIYKKELPVWDPDTNQYLEKEPSEVSEYHFKPKQRLKNPADGDCLLLRCTFPKDKPVEFLFPMRLAYEPIKTASHLANHGIYLKKNEVIIVMDYLIKWGKVLSNELEADIMRNQMGWTDDDRTSFVIGDREYKRDGSVSQSPFSAITDKIGKHMAPKGTFEEWKKAANQLDIPGMELHQYAMLAGFASPLMAYTNTDGGIICLTGDTGAAKTGALFSAVSIWGNPKVLYVHAKKGGTFNALKGRISTLHNMTYAHDEVTNLDAEDLSEMSHMISTGKPKLKMQASVNAERDFESSASMIALFTSNKSIYDKLTALKHDPNGEVARIIEFMLGQPKILQTDLNYGKRVFEAFKANYGHAGSKFIQAIYDLENKGEIIRHFNEDQKLGPRYQKWVDRFVKDYGSDPGDRYYHNLIALPLGAGEVALEYGILDNCNVERIYERLVTEMLNIKNNVIQFNTIDYENILTEFLIKNHSGTLVMRDGKVADEPRTPLVIRAEDDTGTIYIPRSVFNNYLITELDINKADFKKRIVNSDIKFWEEKKRMLTGWKDASSSEYNLMCYAFQKKDILNKVKGDISGSA